MEEDEWALSVEELKLAKSLIYDKISILEIVRQHSKDVVEYPSQSFTHKATCAFHKNGNENHPSMCVDEKTQTFRCFVCNVGGDYFDLLSFYDGVPWTTQVRAFLGKENIDADHLDLESLSTNTVKFDFVYQTNFELGVFLRDHLHSFFGKLLYQEEVDWVDSIFIRIDDRLAKLNDADITQVRGFKYQIIAEIERRKALAKK